MCECRRAQCVLVCVCRSRRKSTERRLNECPPWTLTILWGLDNRCFCSLVAWPQKSHEAWLKKSFSRGGSLPLCMFPMWPVQSWLHGSTLSRYCSSQNVCVWNEPLFFSQQTWEVSAWTTYKSPKCRMFILFVFCPPQQSWVSAATDDCLQFCLSLRREPHPYDLQGGWHFWLNSAQSDRHNFSWETVRSCLLPKCYTDNDYNNRFNSFTGCPFIWSGFIPGLVHREAPWIGDSIPVGVHLPIWPVGGRR